MCESGIRSGYSNSGSLLFEIEMGRIVIDEQQRIAP
jgi:hypothetical protein